jgi:hypothetical protein
MSVVWLRGLTEVEIIQISGKRKIRLPTSKRPWTTIFASSVLALILDGPFLRVRDGGAKLSGGRDYSP